MTRIVVTNYSEGQCRCCGKILKEPTEDSQLCPNCKEEELFSKVRDYITSYKVNEYMVVRKFGIPLKKVREWIHQGRIDYCLAEGRKIEVHYCQCCGVQIELGSLCSPCLKKLKETHHSLGYKKYESLEQLARELVS